MKVITPSESTVYLSDNGHFEARVTDATRGYVFLKYRPLGGRRWTHTSMTAKAFNGSGWKKLEKKGGKRE